MHGWLLDGHLFEQIGGPSVTEARAMLVGLESAVWT